MSGRRSVPDIGAYGAQTPITFSAQNSVRARLWARLEHRRTPRTLDRRYGTLGSPEHTVGGNGGP
eukprot:1131771-Prymnesium_polylepis.1